MQFPPDTPAEFSTLVEKYCWAESSNNRWTMKQICKALERITRLPRPESVGHVTDRSVCGRSSQRHHHSTRKQMVSRDGVIQLECSCYVKNKKFLKTKLKEFMVLLKAMKQMTIMLWFMKIFITICFRHERPPHVVNGKNTGADIERFAGTVCICRS